MNSSPPKASMTSACEGHRGASESVRKPKVTEPRASQSLRGRVRSSGCSAVMEFVPTVAATTSNSDSSKESG
eukprot:8661231-Alexandrium_andersonii.AAC.1